MKDIQHRLEVQRTNLATILVSLLVAVAGVGLLFWSNDPNFWKGREALQGILRDLGSLAVVTVAITLLWELTAKRAFVDELLTKARISQEIAASGVIQFVYEPYPIDWEELFKTTRELDLFFAYAKTWRGTHESKLAELAAREGVTIRVVLPDPDDQGVLKDLAARFNKTPDGIRGRILNAKLDFSQLRSKNLNSGATIEIWYTSLSPVLTLYRFDKAVVITLYSYQRQKAGVPHLVAMSGGYLYDFAVREFQALIGPNSELSRRVE